jgi:hypothetical protein
MLTNLSSVGMADNFVGRRVTKNSASGLELVRWRGEAKAAHEGRRGDPGQNAHGMPHGTRLFHGQLSASIGCMRTIVVFHYSQEFPVGSAEQITLQVHQMGSDSAVLRQSVLGEK